MERISNSLKVREQQLLLLQTLKYLNGKQSEVIMVPISGIAITKGTILNSNEIILSLGADWFAKYSNVDAQNVVTNRLEFINKTLNELECNQNTLKNLHVFGKERNEDGEEFVEIRETEDDFDIEIKDIEVISENAIPIEPQPLDDFDKYLIQRLDELELEEKGIAIPTKDEALVDRQDSANTKRKSVSFDSKVMGKEIFVNDPPSAVSETVVTQISQDIQKEEHIIEPASKKESLIPPKSKPSKTEDILKSSIVVKGLDSSDESEFEDESSDEYDQDILRNEVRIQYLRTRQNLISAGVLEPSTTEEQELIYNAIKLENDAFELESQMFGSKK